MRVGEKETSDQAAIVARYADLFTRVQHEVLRAAEENADGDEAERLFRLREACEGGIVAAELAQRADELENAILACRVAFDGDELPLRSAQATLAVLDGYSDRERLGSLTLAASAGFNDDRLDLMRSAEALEAELSGEQDPVRRSAELKGVDLGALSATLDAASSRIDDAYSALRERWLDRILGDDRDALPSSAHVAYVRRMSPLADTYTEERSVPVCLATLAQLGFDLASETNIRLDLDDRPQKNPRACVIASDPPRVVHLITRAQGGLADYQAFLHEAGHALHYGGCDPGLPYAFRRLARDHALTEIYSFLVESLTHEPGWHAEHFGLDDRLAEDRASATRFLDAFLFRRYAAKLRYELGFWSDFEHAVDHAADYEALVSAASRLPVPARRLPRRHGRGLLLRRLPEGLDPGRAGARVSACRGRGRLVATEGDRRVPQRPLRPWHAPLERGDRRRGRLRSARHGPARRRAVRIDSHSRRWHSGSRSSPRRSTTRCSGRRRRFRTSIACAPRPVTHHFAAVCVLPFAVPSAVENLRGCDVKVATVVSYPLGADSARAKIASAESSIAAGADELGVVLNLPALLSGDFRLVRDELVGLVRAVRVKSVNGGKGIVLLKAIIECHALDDKLKRLACRISEDAGADFVETSTGFAGSTTSVRDVELLRDSLPESLGVKASGGITTAEEAEAMVGAGAGRIGTPHAVEVMHGYAELRRAS